jgi:Family of unknown function (DUF6713)
MATSAGRVEQLYVWTFALGTVHVVDSAYWREWEILGLPGGIELFLLESLALALLFLYGVSRLARGAPSGVVYAIVLAAVSLAGVALHAVLFLRGGAEFRTVASITTLALMLVFATGLLFEAVRLKRAVVAAMARG